MYRLLIGLLLAYSAVVMAQPLEGPFTLYTTTDGVTLSTPHMIPQIIGGGKLFFVQTSPTTGSALVVGDYGYDTHQMTMQPSNLTSTGTLRVEDAMPDWEEEQFVVVSEQSDSARVFFLSHHGTYRIFADLWMGHPWYGGSHMINCRLWPRYGGYGAVVTGTIETSWGWEGDCIASVTAFPSFQALPDWSYAFMPYPLGGFDGLPAVSLTRDSVALLLQGDGPPEWVIVPPVNDSLPRRTPLACQHEILNLGSNDGIVRALAKDSLLHCLAPSMDGTCEELGSQSIPDLPILATAWEPRWGFGVLLADSMTLYLARMDTNGREVQPVGIVARVDTNFRVNDGGLMLRGDTVCVLWTERAYRQPGAARLEIASVGWDAPLTASDPHFIAQPSSLSLAAYPNPFNSALEIRYDLPREQQVELAVYNLLGQKIATLVNGTARAGSHDFLWSPQCGSGIYFVMLKTPDAVRTTKVAYIR